MPVSKTGHFDGWRVVAAAFIVAVFGWGVGFYGPPVYLEAVRQARGWPIALVSGAVTLHFLAGVAVIAGLPSLHRRFGLPGVTFAGATALALGVLGWSLAQTPLQLHAAAVLTGGGWPALGAAAVNAIVSPWFVRKRPAALGMAYNGASIGGVIFSPLWAALIGALGFPVAAALIGAVMLAVIGVLAVSVLGRTPEKVGQLPDGMLLAASPNLQDDSVAQVSQLYRDRAFLTLSIGMALALFAQIGLISQFVSYLVPLLGARGAGFAAGFSTAAAIAGRSLVGWFMPQDTSRRLVAAASLLVQIAGCAAFVAADGSNVPLLILGVALFGLGIGNATSLPPLIAQAEFARADVARVVALTVAIAQAAYAFAPAAFGLIRQTASDRMIFVAAATIQLAAIGAYVLWRPTYRMRPKAMD